MRDCWGVGLRRRDLRHGEWRGAGECVLISTGSRQGGGGFAGGASFPPLTWGGCGACGSDVRHPRHHVGRYGAQPRWGFACDCAHGTHAFGDAIGDAIGDASSVKLRTTARPLGIAKRLPYSERRPPPFFARGFSGRSWPALTVLYTVNFFLFFGFGFAQWVLLDELTIFAR